MKKLLRHSLVSAALLASGPALAEVTINGFLTTAAVVLDSDVDTVYNNGDVTDVARFDNSDSRLGLQFYAPINNRVSATAQLIARNNDYSNPIAADWAYVSMEANADTSVRMGKLKLPTFLLSDYIEVGYAYPWIRPPEEVYSLNPISTLVGLDALYTPTIGSMNLMIQPFVGSNRNTTVITPIRADMMASVDPTKAIPKGTELEFSVDNLFGINMVANFEAFSIRMGALQSTVTQPMFGIVEKNAMFSSVGFTMDWRNIVAYAEYGERDEDPELEKGFPDQRAYYATGGYRMGRFLPHLTYSKIRRGQDASDAAKNQTAITAGLRYELVDGAALKFEVQSIETFGNNYGLFDDPIEDAIIYGVALDVIF